MSPPSTPARRRRVSPLTPEQRRTALVVATAPLLREHGPAVSTRQIAQAAGVAEGTIFGAFPDKAALVRATLLHCLDPAQTVAALRAIDTATDLRTRLATAAELIIRRFADDATLISATHCGAITPDTTGEMHRQMNEGRDRLLAALTAVVEPDRTHLRRSPASVARLLLLFAGANTHGLFGDPDRFTGDEVVELLLDGLLIRPAEGERTC